MIDPKQIENILQDHPRHFRRMVILLGFIELCKSQKKFDFEQIVDRFELSPGYFRMLVDEVIQDSSFEQLLEGDLYQELLKLQLWYKQHEVKYKEIFGFGDFYKKMMGFENPNAGNE